jgi:hypothetical protein
MNYGIDWEDEKIIPSDNPYNVNMHILIIIGAGASHDSIWPEYVRRIHDPYEENRLPLAKELFSLYQYQASLTQHFNLLDISSQVRAEANSKNDEFDIEDVLLKISERAERVSEINTRHSLFKTR